MYIVMKPEHLQYLLLDGGLLQIVQDFAGAMTGRGRGRGGGNTACVIAGGIGEDGLSFVGSVQQCRFGGRAVGMDGAWLALSAAGAYPHRTWLDTCATKTGTGVKAAREHNDWRHGLARSKPVSGELVSTVLQQMSTEDSRSASCASAGWK